MVDFQLDEMQAMLKDYLLMQHQGFYQMNYYRHLTSCQEHRGLYLP